MYSAGMGMGLYVCMYMALVCVLIPCPQQVQMSEGGVSW